VLIPIVMLWLICRWTHPPLPLPDDIPAIHWLDAYATHGGVHALLIVQPLTGWIATSAYRAPITVLGCSMLSPIWSKNRANRRN
jgi:cytochrome b561